MSSASPCTTRAIAWHGRSLELLDQRRLPRACVTVTLTTAAEVAKAIRSMVVRGAPAIGIAAAYGIALDAWRAVADGGGGIEADVHAAADILARARPTAVHLRWAVERMCKVLEEGPEASPAGRARRLEQEARTIHDEDVTINRAIGKHGAPLLEGCSGVLTHCNTGSLATGGYGTALGMIRRAWEDGTRFRVYACETRPFFQGSRLTAWELDNEGIPVTILVDSAAASLMAGGAVQAVVVGADRVAADGSVANKVGTYGLAILAAAHGIPFYVAAPLSTFDPDTIRGAEIPIEFRPADEVRFVEGVQVGASTVDVHNPAFDVTPPRYVTAVITERGLVKPPFERSIAMAVGRTGQREGGGSPWCGPAET